MNEIAASDVAPLADLWPEYWSFHRRRFADTLAPFLEHSTADRGRRLLDLGIFPGFMAKLAARAGFKVSGVSHEEMTPEFRSFARANEMILHQCDIERDRLPFEDGQFSAVLFTETIEHLHQNPYHPLAEAFRVLEPGGLLLVTTPNLCRWKSIQQLLHGESFHPKIEGDFFESFPVNPNYKHCREYTAPELVYLLSDQDTCVYRYETEKIYYSRCWDALFIDFLRSARHFEKPFRQFFAWLIPAVLPRSRSNLIVVARKPKFSVLIPPSRFDHAAGFHDIEEDGDRNSTHRRPLDTPFRWTASQASFSIRLPAETPAGNLRLRLRIGYLAPQEAGPRDVDFAVDGRTVQTLRMVPAKTYRVVDLPVDSSPARAGAVRIDIRSTTWKPASLGFPDSRELGIMLAWGDALLYNQVDTGVTRTTRIRP
jgi:SAM-dependent methyltransferase